MSTMEGRALDDGNNSVIVTWGGHDDIIIVVDFLPEVINWNVGWLYEIPLNSHQTLANEQDRQLIRVWVRAGVSFFSKNDYFDQFGADRIYLMMQLQPVQGTTTTVEIGRILSSTDARIRL